ncbi:MAG: hypothetical protein NTY43_06055 [Bacteroidetes bacterium]|nr:hypothetical protein [Bacteroidota bacterium]
MSEFYGVFSNYEIEDVYKFIGTERVENRLKELELLPTMGTTLNDFVSKDIKYLGVGLINIFNMILDYFPDDTELAIFLYNKSKHYNESNYFSSQKQKKDRIEYIEMMNRMILRGEDVDYYQAKLNSPFWLEIHFFYMTLMKLFVKKQSDTKIDEVVRGMSNNYINNFESISKLVLMDFGQKLANGFISFASSYFDEEDELIITLIELNNKHSEIWLSH